MRYKPNKQGYIINYEREIEPITYGQYLREYGGDETTTPKGLAPRCFLDKRTIYSWGCTGNRLREVGRYKTRAEAKIALYDIWEWNIDNKFGTPEFFARKKYAYEYLAEEMETTVEVLKRYFRFIQYLKQAKEAKRLEAIRIKNSKPRITETMMLDYIKNNLNSVVKDVLELDKLKEIGNKDLWHVKANALVQRVSQNDFRELSWKEVYSLIKNSVDNYLVE